MNKILIVLFFSLSIIYPQQMLSSEGTIFGTLNNNTETRIIKEYYEIEKDKDVKFEKFED